MSSKPAVCSRACARVTGAWSRHGLSSSSSGRACRSGRSRSSAPLLVQRHRPEPDDALGDRGDAEDRVHGDSLAGLQVRDPDARGPPHTGAIRRARPRRPAPPSRSSTAPIRARSSSRSRGGPAAVGRRIDGDRGQGSLRQHRGVDGRWARHEQRPGRQRQHARRDDHGGPCRVHVSTVPRRPPARCPILGAISACSKPPFTRAHERRESAPGSVRSGAWRGRGRWIRRSGPASPIRRRAVRRAPGAVRVGSETPP